MNVEDLPIAVLVLDAERRIISVNDEAARVLRVEGKELVGRDLIQSLHPRTSSGEDLLLNGWHVSTRLKSVRKITPQEVCLRCGDGAESVFSLDGGYERDGLGNLIGATLLLRPRERGQRRPSAGVRIVSAVSHELRSPLTSVRGYTSLLLKRWDSVEEEDRRQMLGQIDQDARRISRMIGELLDISRLEMGRIQLNRRSVDLREAIARVVANVRLTYSDIEVDVDVPSSARTVWADPDKLDQVLTNLFENACKYASTKGIGISAKVDDAVVVIEVSDQGPGIPQADLPRLFQQFFRSSQGRPSGTGLGLWISRGIIESHGGEMTATSDGTTGTQFRFTLPKSTSHSSGF